MKRKWGVKTLVLAMLLAPATANAESSEIEHRCTVRYPSITQYFAWKDCVKTETQREAEEFVERQAKEAKRLEEEAARPCLAADIHRMEELAAKAAASIKSESTLEEAKAALYLITGLEGEIIIPKDGIKDHVLVNLIRTKCDAPFRFWINVREGPEKKLLWVRTWAADAPAGYPEGLHKEFSAEFEAQREQERWRAEAQKRDDDLKALLLKHDQEQEEQRQKSLRSAKISDVRMKCFSAGSCSMRSVEFVVANVSQRPLKTISFGWMFLSSQMTECPTNLATKETDYSMVLQPGEKARHTILVTDAPENRDAKFCLRVTGFGYTRFD